MTISLKNQERFESLCLVGMGGHARSKLLPAALANGQQIAGLVSRQDPSTFPGHRVFSSLGDALAGLPAGVLVVIATPPAIHADQVAACATSGFDVMVEKPAFVSLDEAEAIRAACERMGTLVIEGFMQRHTNLYARMVANWAHFRRRVRQISINFLIPQMPEDTFRTGGGVASSTLYDIGCYPVSLLLDLGLDVSALGVAEVRYPGDAAREAIRLTGILDGVPTEVEVGVAEAYSNSVSLRFEGNDGLRFEPFFFGRAGDRHITTVLDGAEHNEIVSEKNAFERMFEIPRRTWLSNETQRWDVMSSAAATLNRLAVEVAAHRARV